MKAITRLVTSDLSKHRVRAGLTVAAIVMAVSLVVAMTSGFDSVRAAAKTVLGSFFEDVDIIVRPYDERGELIDRDTVEALRADERVKSLTTSLTTRAPAMSPKNAAAGKRPAQLVGRTPPKPGMEKQDIQAGGWFTNGPVREAVIEDPIAQQFKLAVGDTIELPSPTGSLNLKVVGIVARPAMMRMDSPVIYVPLGTLQSWLGVSGRVNRIDIELKNHHDTDGFVADWNNWSQGTAPLHVKSARTETGKLDQSMQGLEILTYMGGTVSMVAAMFIVFSALSMGVAERSRVMAMLRAIGAMRVQVAEVVIVEALILAAIAIPVGVALGYTWIVILYWWKPHLFSAGILLSKGGTIYACGGALVSVLGAAILPAWSASRVDVLEAMTAVGRPSSMKWARLAFVLGAVLLCVDPAVTWTPGIERMVRLYVHLFVGLPCVMLGLFGIAPMLVIVVERLLGGVVARLMRLEPALLKQQLSGGVWRTAGTAAGLMVGLACLVSMQTVGQSLLSGFKLPTKFPDLLMFAPFGLDEKQIAAVQEMEGVAEPGIMPVAIVSPQLGANIFDLGGAVKMPDATIMFGLPVDQAFGTDTKDDGLVGLEYVQGDEKTARRLLKQGRHVVVSDQFRALGNLKVGDKMTFNTPKHGPVEYTIAGIAKANGVEVLVRIFDMRQEFERWTASSVVTTLEDVQRDFGVNRIYMFAANYEEAASRKKVAKSVKEQLGTWGLLSADAKQIKKWADVTLARLLNLMSTVALAAIGVASLGVTNTIMAGVRVRRWQFGVLRSMGLTRAALLRLVLAEALLIGAIGSVLGLIGGVLMGIDGTHFSGIITGFFAPLVVPGETMAMGLGITLAVAAAASLWPALSVSRAETLTLLKSGRAST